jgi:dienelactone hydrolase
LTGDRRRTGFSAPFVQACKVPGVDVMIRPSILFVTFLALGCGGESSSSIVGTMSNSGPSIHFVTDAEVTRVFLPEQVHVRLTGFPPASPVTLTASIPGYVSHASFLADATGSVDVASQAPLDGTYQGADADGLFWSMVATGEPPASPSTSTSSDVTVRAEVGGRVVTSATLARYPVADDLVETQVHEDGLVAVFITPAAPGPHPALLVFGGSEGGIDYGLKYARHYASLGYSCLGIAYFDTPGLPHYLEKLPLEYFGKALSWMKGRPEVKADAIGVLGASRGGELALLLGATFPEVKAVVAMVPSGVAWSGWDPHRPENYSASSWTFGGKELPYVPDTGALPTWTMDDEGRTVERGTPMFLAALDAASPAALDAATTRVEKVQGPVLMLASDDDQIWPSCRLAELAMKRLDATGHAASFADDYVCYPGAGHHMGMPGLPTTDPALVKSDRHIWLALGGNPAGIAHAERDAFERKRAFLAKALR